MPLKVIFMGTPEFAVASLDALCKSRHEVVAVVTVPDKPAGRGQKLQYSAVKQYALENQISVLQPEKLKDENFVTELKSLNADLFVVVAFRMLPEIVWAMPSKGTFNLHGSLLPQYRGAAPINWAVINGEKETGVTTFLIEKEIDTGNILFSEKIDISISDNAGIVHDKLMEVGAKLVVKTVDAIENANISPVKQPMSGSMKPAPKIFKETCRIDWNKSCLDVHNLVRGLSPYPASWSVLADESGNQLMCKIFETIILNEMTNGAAGTIFADNKTIKVACADGLLQLNSIQMEGKKRLSAEEFLRGFYTIAKYHFI